jgi:hypothetical protein
VDPRAFGAKGTATRAYRLTADASPHSPLLPDQPASARRSCQQQHLLEEHDGITT